ncbi:hypothetical protein IWW45_008612 [Coemansia sp. RSA 485]|nr:hypothetical protein IWW45_008612 [Coemansia sp. RSA 485]
MVVQTQAASAQPHTYYPQHHYYHHHYSSQSKQQPHQLPSQQQSQQSQQSQSLPQPRRTQMQSTVGYPHVPRISVPFPKPGSDAAARSTPTSPEYPSSTVGGMVRSPGALASQHPTQGATTHMSEKTGIMISSGQGVSSQTQQMAMHASSYSQKSVSASTEDPSPQRTRAPDSPFSGTYQHTQPISNVMRSPTIRQRQRGQSMSSVSSSRRRDSRSEHKLPYSRPVGETQSPKSPQAQIPSALAQSPRRTYRRHPKKDPNAPEKWRSAYQLFRDDVNRELHGQDIPFSEMSKIHSKRWTDLSDEKRTVYFERSRQDKEDYAAKMTVYEKTPEFRQYSEYLDKFYKQESTVNRVGRPKGTKSSKAKGKGPDRGGSEEYDYENSPSIGAAKPSMSASSSPPPSLSSLDRSPG